MQPRDEMRLAVLIDADNAPRTQLKEIMEEIAVYGTPTIKRIYGDWTAANMESWKEPLLHNAVTPIQQYGYTKGKNSTDSAMIIDAMDILYSGRVEGFCLVSSDSDFTRLATRLREAGMKVIGLGEKKTPAPFIVACDKFIYIEIIRGADRQDKKQRQRRPKNEQQHKQPAAVSAETQDREQPAPASQVPASEAVNKPMGGGRPPREVIDLILTTIDDVADDDGWAYLGEVGTLIVKKQPAFDPRSFGHKKLTQLIQAIDEIIMEFRPNIIANNGQLIFVRLK